MMSGLAVKFSDKDRRVIADLALRLTGSGTSSHPKVESSLLSIARRMQVKNCETLAEYLVHVENANDELAHLISALTIHTTSWFRERPHFERLSNIANDALNAWKSGERTTIFRVLSAGCSTGEEGYSIALVLESIRQNCAAFDYEVEGWDVDPVSVARANHAVYAVTGRDDIPRDLRRFLLVGTGKTHGLFTLTKEIRDRVHFKRRNLVEVTASKSIPFDLIFCRNVLIYFKPEIVANIVRGLIDNLVVGGHMCLGHSEGIDAENYRLSALGNTTYRKQAENATKNESTAASQIKRPTRLQRRPDLIVIGASTGGTEVLVRLLQSLPQPCPPVMVVQHIASSFARSFAERLSKSCGLPLGSISQGELIQNNHLYMALDDYHIGVKRRGGMLRLETSREGPIHSVRPAVDFLFRSVAQTMGQSAVLAIILTGMGKDGARGLKDLFDLGAETMAQDEASSVVFGMPREAITMGAAEFVGNPSAIRQRILQALKLVPVDQASSRTLQLVKTPAP